MKQILFILSIATCLLSCNNKKPEAGIAGEYLKGDNSITITKRSSEIEVLICFADETCIEPCYTGLLKSSGNQRYSGWIHPEIDTTEKFLAVISSFNNEIELWFPQRGKIGMNCDPEGVYKK